MKVTKVDHRRSGVSRVKVGDTRGILYETPDNKKGIGLEKQLNNRINAANRLYNVYFISDIPMELDEHFKRIVAVAAAQNQPGGVKKAVKAYKGYTEIKPRERRHDIQRFSYKPGAGKQIEQVLAMYVQERLTDYWQCDRYKNAAVRLLMAICRGREFGRQIDDLWDEELKCFWEASKNCPMNEKFPVVYVTSSVSFERNFTELMKIVVSKDSSRIMKAYQKDNNRDEIDQILEQQCDLLENLEELVIKKRVRGQEQINRVVLKEISWPYATEKRLQVMAVRMRKTLKRGSDREIAIELQRGLAQMDGETLGSVVKRLSRNEETKRQLKHFLNSLNKDYYKFDVLHSLKRLDVKIQPDSCTDDAAILLNMSNCNSKKKQGLNVTLERYASSEQESIQTLIDIKEILLEYFQIEESRDRYLDEKNLWVFPKNYFAYMDENFVPYSGENESGESEIDNNPVAMSTLEKMWEQSALDTKKNLSQMKNRIKYVNCGYYQRLAAIYQNDPFRMYWMTFIKNYVEKNYTGKKRLSEEDCRSCSMMKACWTEIIKYLCGKYIDLGKAVYHFAMPSDMIPMNGAKYGVVQSVYRDGISSFDYEVIKAEETLQRDIAVAMMSASSAFTASIIDEQKRKKQEAGGNENLEDVMVLKESELAPILKDNVKAQILRFYGGNSTVTGDEWHGADVDVALTMEIKGHLAAIRNENFHYTDGKEGRIDSKYTELLWENDRKAFGDIIRKRYYSNNTAMFYKVQDIQDLVKALYNTNGKTAESQIPAFRTIFKRKELPEYIINSIAGKDQKLHFAADTAENTNLEVIYQGALYYLLKEIYYHDFILRDDAKGYFYQAVTDYKLENAGDGKDRNFKKTKYANPALNFDRYITELKDKMPDATLGNVCQMVLQEYNQQNAGKGDEEIYKHFKMLFPLCMKNGFCQFVKVHYGWLLDPKYHKIDGEPDYLQAVCVHTDDVIRDRESIIWYTFTHFIHPRQLNYLAGNFKNYIQYRKDIMARQICARQNISQEERIALENSVKRAEKILQVMNFVQGVSGRVSNIFEDYYVDKEEYARYLRQFIDFPLNGGTAFDSLRIFCQTALRKDGEIIDIYADAENPKILRNVEITRMYAGGDLPLAGRKKVSREEICTYYDRKQKVENILKKGICKDEDEQKEVVGQQQRKNRLMLNDVTDIYAIINDMLGKLISLAYLKERDQMYMLMGFYYMALRSADQWTGEELQQLVLDSNHQKNPQEDVRVAAGLVLYQIVSIYDYGKKLIYGEVREGARRIGDRSGQLSSKIVKFYQLHRKSMTSALRLFEEDKVSNEAVQLRNYVDHNKYYMNHDKSMVELYSQFYSRFFWYSRKLKNSVVHNFQSILESYFIESKIRYNYGKEKTGFELQTDVKTGRSIGLASVKFTYKLKDNRTCQILARNRDFVDTLREVLNYKKVK